MVENKKVNSVSVEMTRLDPRRPLEVPGMRGPRHSLLGLRPVGPEAGMTKDCFGLKNRPRNDTILGNGVRRILYKVCPISRLFQGLEGLFGKAFSSANRRWRSVYGWFYFVWVSRKLAFPLFKPVHMHNALWCADDDIMFLEIF